MSASRPAAERRALSEWSLRAPWLAIWLLLLASLLHPAASAWLALACLAHLLLFLLRADGRIDDFAVQVRLAFLALVAIAVVVPGATPLLWLPLLGVAARVLTGYCLMARLVALLPWNRSRPLDLAALRQALFSAPTRGRFRIDAAPGAGNSPL